MIYSQLYTWYAWDLLLIRLGYKFNIPVICLRNIKQQVQIVTRKNCNTCKFQHVQFSTVQSSTHAICNMGKFQHMQIATHTNCNTCELQHMQIAIRANCNTCILQHVQITICTNNNNNNNHMVYFQVIRYELIRANTMFDVSWLVCTYNSLTRTNCNMCKLQHLQFAAHAIYNTCNLQHAQFATCAICNMCNFWFL